MTELFERAHERGINTCLDSSLAPFTRDPEWLAKFDRLIAACDLVLADIKHIDPERHRDLTGRDNANILDCLHYLSEKGAPVWIRHVLVPGITDVDEYLERTRAFIETLGNVQRIEVLPYHTLGIFKWDELGLPYTLRDVDPPTPERVATPSASFADRRRTSRGVRAQAVRPCQAPVQHAKPVPLSASTDAETKTAAPRLLPQQRRKKEETCS